MCRLLSMYLEHHVIYSTNTLHLRFSQKMVETKSITIDYTPVGKSLDTCIIPLDNSILFEHYCNMNTAPVHVGILLVLSVATVRKNLSIFKVDEKSGNFTLRLPQSFFRIFFIHV